MYLEMCKDIEEATIKLAKNIKEIGIDNVEFEYMKDNNFYKISISEYKNYWEITHRECISKSTRADIFRMKFEDNKMTFQWSEKE